MTVFLSILKISRKHFKNPQNSPKNVENRVVFGGSLQGLSQIGKKILSKITHVFAEKHQELSVLGQVLSVFDHDFEPKRVPLEVIFSHPYINFTVSKRHSKRNAGGNDLLF